MKNISTKIKKYDDKEIQNCIKLNKEGYSLRQIAKLTNIPSSSVYNLINKNTINSHNYRQNKLDGHLNREQAKVQYNISSSKFDSLRVSYPNYFTKVGYSVFIKISFFKDMNIIWDILELDRKYVKLQMQDRINIIDLYDSLQFTTKELSLKYKVNIRTIQSIVKS